MNYTALASEEKIVYRIVNHNDILLVWHHSYERNSSYWTIEKNPAVTTTTTTTTMISVTYNG